MAYLLQLFAQFTPNQRKLNCFQHRLFCRNRRFDSNSVNHNFSNTVCEKQKKTIGKLLLVQTPQPNLNLNQSQNQKHTILQKLLQDEVAGPYSLLLLI